MNKTIVRPNCVVDEHVDENDNMDLDQNESYFTNQNNEYTEPIGYGSPLNFGYTSVDEHIDEVKV